MATTVATQPTADTEAQTRLRQAIADVQRQVVASDKAELAQARETLERVAVKALQEYRRLGMPLTERSPVVVGQAPPPSPERVAQLARLDHAAALLEQARQVRAQANLALAQMR